MELRQLEYFVAVAAESGFTTAAARVRTTQPNISAQIRGLERELGARLFDRSGRRVTLTDAGRAALPAARDALTAAESVRQSVAEVNQVVRGHLSVGMVDGCTVRPLFATLGLFRDRHPGVGLSLTEDASDGLVARVLRGELDIALAGYAGDLPAGVDELPVVRERVVAAIPRNHPLSSKKTLSLRDLRDHPLVGLPRGAGIRTAFDRGAGDIRISLEASSPDAVVELVASGLGIGVLSESIVADRADAVAGRPIRGVNDQASLGFVWRTSAGPAVHAFLALARREFGFDVDQAVS
ncbi:LysR family transcriptional regulator [Gordonia hankookensis]|uniref:LysR family transcriptional regulator n=1 Tax=Gordonia hankookensis TaxID=589403 RepID=A0ABR7WE79_9ACTN|nr:LysR family transcriptional regulator [Gordonia hankookensis]MBD1320054.1 LysR family transcriptional regulator [Gordonia hankookensis]